MNHISISVEKTKRSDGRPESVHSVDSVNLDELINANYTVDMDDETDLTDLANLDIIDDSTEDFWNLNQVLNKRKKKKKYIVITSLFHTHRMKICLALLIMGLMSS